MFLSFYKPCKPIPLNFGGTISPWGGVSETPGFAVFSGGSPWGVKLSPPKFLGGPLSVHLGGEIGTPEFRGYGLTEKDSH